MDRAWFIFIRADSHKTQKTFTSTRDIFFISPFPRGPPKPHLIKNSFSLHSQANPAGIPLPNTLQNLNANINFLIQSQGKLSLRWKIKEVRYIGYTSQETKRRVQTLFTPPYSQPGIGGGLEKSPKIALPLWNSLRTLSSIK